MAEQDDDAGRAERASWPRRVYLYGIALLGALLILFELAQVVYRLLLWTLGDPNADFFGAETLDGLVRAGAADVRPMRTIVSKLRRKLGDDADRPAYILTEPWGGLLDAQGGTQG